MELEPLAWVNGEDSPTLEPNGDNLAFVSHNASTEKRVTRTTTTPTEELGMTNKEMEVRLLARIAAVESLVFHILLALNANGDAATMLQTAKPTWRSMAQRKGLSEAGRLAINETIDLIDRLLDVLDKGKSDESAQ